MIVFYHDDMDGRCAAHLVLECNPEARAMSVDYTTPLADMKAVTKRGESVWFLDFSLKPMDYYDFIKSTDTDPIWIDHHKTAIEEYTKHAYLFAKCDKGKSGIRKDGVAGCMLTWCYLNKIGTNPVPAELAPFYVRLIADRDVWTFKYGADTRNFHAGMMARDTHPAAPIWNELFIDETHDRRVLEQILDEGEIIRRFQDQERKTYIAKKGHMMEVGPLLCMAANRRDSSDLFATVPGEYDAWFTYEFNGRGWECTLYAAKEGVDVSTVAQAFGGGGHKGAAGFEVHDINTLLVHGAFEYI